MFLLIRPGAVVKFVGFVVLVVVVVLVLVVGA